jgi:hypothetical protein
MRVSRVFNCEHHYRLVKFEQTASANEQILTPGDLKRLVSSEPSQSGCEGTTMLIADYIAISVLIVLALWAGVERFLRGKRFIFPNAPQPRV